MCMFATAGTAFVYISLNASKRYNFQSYRPWTFISKSQGPFFRYSIPSQAQVWYKYSLQETTSRYISYKQFMIASSNEIIFRVTDPLWGESIGHRCIPLTKASGAELWCFLWCASEQTVKWTIEMAVLWDAMVLTVTSLICKIGTSQLISNALSYSGVTALNTCQTNQTNSFAGDAITNYKQRWNGMETGYTFGISNMLLWELFQLTKVAFRGRLNIKVLSYQYRAPTLKIRRSQDHRIFNMGMPHLERLSLYWDGALCSVAI